MKHILRWSVGWVLFLINSGSFLLDLNSKAYWFVMVELDTRDLHLPKRYSILDKVFDAEYGASVDAIFGRWIKGAMRNIVTSSGAELD